MPIQTATTAELDEAQNIILAQSRYTSEHSAPCKNLIEQFRLPKGHKQMTIPKVGQMEMADLTDGVDMVATEAIQMTTTDLTCNEVGAKVILTDKLVRQLNEDTFRMVGRQLGDAKARKVDEDIISLFDGFSASLGGTTSYAFLNNVVGVIGYAKAHKFGTPLSFVHHPNAILQVTKSALNIGSTYYLGIMQGLPEELLRNFWKFYISGANCFEDGNIPEYTTDLGKGAIFAKSALCYIESQAFNVERERDASLRAWELNMVGDYGVFELDDSQGAEVIYYINDIPTTS